MKNSSLLHKFWLEHPALLAGVTFLFGSGAWLFTPWYLLFGLYLLWLRKKGSLFFLFASFAYAWYLYSPMQSLPLPLETSGLFSPTSVQLHDSSFGEGFVYRGHFTPDKTRATFPCSLFWHKAEVDRPIASQDLYIQGRLIQNPLSCDYILKPKEWTPLKGTFRLAEWRFSLKQRLHDYLKDHLTQEKTALFLMSLVTGEVESRELRYDFAKIGLQHILAISGFHFFLLAAFLSFFLTRFFPQRKVLWFLLIALNGYFLFVGPAPSITRGWIVSQLWLIGELSRKTTSGLNLLGMALLLEALFDPMISANIGFQLSFLSCTAILLIHPWLREQLRRLFPARSRKEISQLTYFSMHSYLALFGLIDALSLTLAVNMLILPLLLYHFHEFPLLSLFYNLFFPFLSTAALFFLLIALLFPPLFFLPDFLTTQLLEFSSYPPLLLDFPLLCNSIPLAFLLLYIFTLIHFYVDRRHQRKERLSTHR